MTVVAAPRSGSGSRASAYSSLAEQLRSEIRRQLYPQGVALPTEAELSARHGVSRQTVRRAFQDLVAEGVVYRIPGRGTFAFNDDGKFVRSSGSIEDLLSLSEDTEMEILEPPQSCIDVNAAGRLQLPTDEVVTLLFRRFHDGKPYCVTRAYLSPDLGRRVAAAREFPAPGSRHRLTVLSIVQAKSGSALAVADQSISAVTAPTDLCSFIDCRPGEPVLRIDRLYFGRESKPIELAINFFHPGRYSYRCQLRSGAR